MHGYLLKVISGPTKSVVFVATYCERSLVIQKLLCV